MRKDSQETGNRIPWPEDEPVVPLWPDAAEPFRVKRSRAYQLAQGGRFPCDVLLIGGRWMVRTSDLRRALGLQVHKDEIVAAS
jgi:hypothetical protein